jgi:parallel beta-helix repeat protein
MRRVAIRICLCVVSISLVVPAMAGEGRIPIWEPTVITQDGNYIVTRDIASPGGPVIQVTGLRSVEIDLNGFTLYGPSGGGAAIQANEVINLTVRNGTLWATGPPSDGIGAFDTHKVVIEDVKFQDHSSSGIYLTNPLQVAIRRNIVIGGADGLFIQGPGEGVEGIIEQNVFKAVGAGINVDTATSLSILNNQIVGADDAVVGIDLTTANSCIVAQNTVEGFSYGIELLFALGNKIYNNTVHRCGEGFRIIDSSGNLILENVSNLNSSYGMYVTGGFNRIHGNVLTDNGDVGLWLAGSSSGNVYTRNLMRANGGTPQTCTNATTACLDTDLCDNGTGNTTFGDNVGPDPC